MLAERYLDARHGLDRSGEPNGHDCPLICLKDSTSG
jgi:hypothetical protein